MRIVLLLAAGWALSGSTPASGGEPESEQAEFFEARIRPILVEHCHRVPRPEEAGGGPAARLAARPAQGERRRAGRRCRASPRRARSIEAIRPRRADQDAAREASCPARRSPTSTDWVKMGAPWPEPAAHVAGGPTPTRRRGREAALGVPAGPGPAAARGPRPRPGRATSVDRFILARLEAKGLSPSPPADRRTLIRRATFDLTACRRRPRRSPPSRPTRRPTPTPRLVDRLLASPHYGERWGRHWLDVARYADTKGYVFFQDADFHWAYTYRDYVIRAFNDDLPTTGSSSSSSPPTGCRPGDDRAAR